MRTNDGELSPGVLINAAKKGDTDAVLLLLKLGADINELDEYGHNALMWASHLGHADTVRVLLEQKADVNYASKNGYTAFLLSAMYGHEDVVKLLMENGADITRRTTTGDNAVALAQDNSYTGLAQMLNGIISAADTDVQEAERHARSLEKQQRLKDMARQHQRQAPRHTP